MASDPVLPAESVAHPDTAEGERLRVVAWLRARAKAASGGNGVGTMLYNMAANDIENGKHLEQHNDGPES